MQNRFRFILLTVILVVNASLLSCSNKSEEAAMPKTVYDFTVKDIDGNEVSLAEHKGKVMMIVNVASKCGFTKQYEGLQTLHEKYADRGLVILGFPSNQFGSQEPGTEEEIMEFCTTNFGVSFPMFAKIDVNGDQAEPLYTYLKKEAPGMLNTKAIKWNFTKFLIDREGNVIDRYGSAEKPEDLEETIVKYL